MSPRSSLAHQGLISWASSHEQELIRAVSKGYRDEIDVETFLAMKRARQEQLEFRRGGGQLPAEQVIFTTPKWIRELPQGRFRMETQALSVDGYMRCLERRVRGKNQSY